MATIAYIGSFARSYNTEVHLARDARSLGHEVIELEERAVADNLRAHDTGGPHIEIPECDLVLYTKSTGLPPAAIDMWRGLEIDGIRTASFHLDLYRGLARGDEMLDDPFWQTGDVFTADGDPATSAELELLGVRHHWLPAACVSDEAVLVEELPRDTAAQIVFVGSSRSYHPEWPWRLEMLSELRRVYGPAFQVFGPQEGELLEGLRLNALYQQPGRIVIGDSLALPGHSNYWSNRYYETLGRGGFLIAPHVPGIDAHFRDVEHLRYYEVGDLPYLIDLIDHYRSAVDAVRSTRHRGQAHVREFHTYRHRVASMLETLELA